MLYFNTTTNKRYNDRTLALYGFTPADADVHPLEVNYPAVDEKFETYRDTQNVDVDTGVYSVSFEVLDLPKDKVVENVTPIYEQNLYIKRAANVDVSGDIIQNPETSLVTFKAWRTAMQNSIPFDPTENPFVTAEPTTIDTLLLDGLIAGLEDHLTRCDTIATEIPTHLDATTVADLKLEDPTAWVEGRYVALAPVA